jgi:SNF2 family DNA or RNA helicase
VDGCNVIAKVLYENLGIDSQVLTGEISPKGRQARIDEWRKTPSQKALICSISAERTARTFNEANHCIFLDMDWSPLNIEQAWKRVHRFGQTKEVSVDYICCNSTIDQVMYDTVLVKQKSTNIAVDRRNKTDYAENKISAFEIAKQLLSFNAEFATELRTIRKTGIAYIQELGEEIAELRHGRGGL